MNYLLFNFIKTVSCPPFDRLTMDVVFNALPGLRPQTVWDLPVCFATQQVMIN